MECLLCSPLPPFPSLLDDVLEDHSLNIKPKPKRNKKQKTKRKLVLYWWVGRCLRRRRGRRVTRLLPFAELPELPGINHRGDSRSGNALARRPDQHGWSRR